MFIAAMSTISKLWKEPRCPSTGEWIKKMWYLYTMEYYAAMKRNEILPFVEKVGLTLFKSWPLYKQHAVMEILVWDKTVLNHSSTMS